jgi:hypothetical protein
MLGKRSLWRALAVIAPSDPRLTGIDFAALVSRAQKQYDSVERRRLSAAGAALGPDRPIGFYDSDSSSQASNGLSARKSTIVGSIAITVGVLLAVSMLPDIARYMKIRAM